MFSTYLNINCVFWQDRAEAGDARGRRVVGWRGQRHAHGQARLSCLRQSGDPEESRAILWPGRRYVESWSHPIYDVGRQVCTKHQQLFNPNLASRIGRELGCFSGFYSWCTSLWWVRIPLHSASRKCKKQVQTKLYHLLIQIWFIYDIITFTKWILYFDRWKTHSSYVYRNNRELS